MLMTPLVVADNNVNDTTWYFVFHNKRSNTFYLNTRQPRDPRDWDACTLEWAGLS